MQQNREMIYSAQKTGFEEGRRYSNPHYFDKIKSDVDKVIIVGNWPKIEQAYKAAGVEVQVVSEALPKKDAAALINGTNGRRVEAATVAIPEDFASMSWDGLRALSAQLSDVPAINSQEAKAIIEAELKVRGGATIDLGLLDAETFSDDQLRGIIKDVSGKAPHHKLGREKLVAMVNELNAEAAKAE